jgi:AbrB family looped-hinge helix DNA binding protein
VEYVLRVDGRGRIVIPSEVRKRLGIGRLVRLRVEDGRAVIEPVRDPLEELSRLLVGVRVKASTEPEKLSTEAYRRLLEELRGEGQP